jgi:hypothetical protein
MAKTRRKTENSSAEEFAMQAAGGKETTHVDPDRVALRAYELYVARGCGEGRDLDDWLSAERELNSATGVGSRAPGEPERDES